MWDYTDTVKDHFRNPRNVGEIENPDCVGEVGSLACGDALKLTIRLGEGERIADAKFLTFGCASAIASSSALTEIVKGMTLAEAEKVTNQDIADYLGELPEQKMHCSVMGREALEAAIRNYRTGSTEKVGLEGRVVCTCFGVTETEIERVVRENDLSEIEQVTNYCKAGGGCGACRSEIQKIVDRVRGASEQPRTAPRPARMTNIQKIKLIEETIDREIRPSLVKDGGDIELIDVEGDRVLVSPRGTCSTCPASPITLKDLVEAKLREFVSEELRVEEVKA
ncbi:Fe-S cluster assembly protein NifU [Candidatus Sumerlaeota bacterium]|nr:Fe-S cluster assembly protein NifU [Candidatus Sumerlaeota bacterium]